jgi:diadenosine tetraphosphatase ApaH/serine/threonine PP2A family protein phosphatase
MVYTRLVIACLYDVHGNLPALEAVLADLGDAERYILGGDYALFGGWPGETVARLRELEPALWIRGNGERWTADPPEQLREAVAAVRAELGDELVAELAALPETAEDGDMLICHGSPVSDVRSFLPEPAEDEGELLAGVTASRLLFGHTHIQFRRMAGGIELVNPGSVGVPLDGDHRAAYAVIHDDGGLEHRRVAYDHVASAAKVRSLGDWAEVMAQRIERARMEGR